MALKTPTPIANKTTPIIAPEGLDQDIVNLARAIRIVETGEQNKKGGSGESGMYQFMPATWANLAKKYLGDSKAKQTRENENFVAYNSIKDMKAKGLNPAQIASTWNSGSPEWEGKIGVNKQGIKYDVPSYVNKVYTTYQGQKKLVEGHISSAKQWSEIEKSIANPPESAIKKIADFTTETFVSPMVKQILRPFITGIKDIMPEYTGMETPFGKVEPYGTKKEMFTDAAILGATAAIPVEKLFVPVLRPLLKPFGKAFKYTASLIGGYPREMLEVAYKKPQIVADSIKSAAKDSDFALNLVNKAKSAFQAVKDFRNEQYRTALETIEKNYWKTKKGTSYFKKPDGVWYPINLTTKGVKDTITKTLKDFKVVFEKGSPNFKYTPLPKGQQNEIIELIDRVYDWDKITPTGLDNLRQVIDSYYKGGKDTAQFDAIITRIKKNLSDYVSTRIPEIGKMNTDYSAMTKIINQMQKELSLGEGRSIDTAVNALTSLFNKKSPLRKNLVEELGKYGGEDLMDDIIAQTLKDWLPVGRLRQLGLALGAMTLSPITLMKAIASAPLASPRISAGIATGMGKLAQTIPSVMEKLAPVIRGGAVLKEESMQEQGGTLDYFKGLLRK